MKYDAQAEKLTNTCQIGNIEPIYENNKIVETYCRCPRGNFGFTCEENFENPCLYQEGEQVYAADSRLTRNYYIECNWNVPFLFKCPTPLSWDQTHKTCSS